MSKTDSSNQYFKLAVQFVNQTSQHLFLTGKAGTGKTTFLRYIKENSFKKLAIVAPTGVAAINAGGVTIHSMFQLPFGSFLPISKSAGEHTSLGFTDQNSIFQNMKFNSAKRTLLQELELLIIDEVSMLRADMLDAIDTVLRHFRRQPLLPFGGVQMLFIGDLYQLPPVVSNNEWQVLGRYYKSPFFFDAQVLKQVPPLYLELKKIYRQSDAVFIDILNNIRNNTTQATDLDVLHKYYRPGFQPEKKGEFITLTTHNSKAETINQGELQKLTSPTFTYEAEVKGEFNEKSVPAEKFLYLKEGSQIMFLKNDKGEERRYYNGKIGTVKSLDASKIVVVFPESEDEFTVEKETWANIRYSFNKEHDKIDEEELGTFTQYPIRLAWAITIHKSQGLTFDKAIVDAGDSFAAGQVYVALSRLTTLDGLVLYSRINPSAISTDERVVAFTQTELQADVLEQQLKVEQKIFIANSLLWAYDWTKLSTALNEHWEGFTHRQIPQQNESEEMTHVWLDKTIMHQEVADKFVRQLGQLLPNAEQDGYQQLYLRIEAASKYFLNLLDENLVIPMDAHFEDMKNRAKVKKYLKELQEVITLVKRKKILIQQSVAIAKGLMIGTDTDALLTQVEDQKKAAVNEVIEQIKEIPKSAPAVKGESHRTSLQLFKEGKTAAEIAEARSMSPGTIEGHLISFIPTGEIDIHELVSDEKYKVIVDTITEVGDVLHSELKAKLGDDYTYGEIKAVAMYRKKMDEMAQNSNA